MSYVSQFVPLEEFEVAHPLLLRFLLLEHVALLRVDAVAVLHHEPVEMPLLEVVFLHEQSLHVLDFFRNDARLALEHKDRVLVEAQVSTLLEFFLLVDLEAAIPDPRSVRDELGNALR